MPTYVLILLKFNFFGIFDQSDNFYNLFKIKPPQEVGVYKSTGSANGSKVFKGPKHGLYYINGNSKKSYIKKEKIDALVEFNEY